MDTEGLFRLSGASSNIQSLKLSLQNYTVGEVEPHAIASVIKMFLREMPVPLLSFELYEPLIHLVSVFPIRNSSEQDQFRVQVAIAWLLDMLDPLHWKVTQRLALFFYKLTQHTDKNKVLHFVAYV